MLCPLSPAHLAALTAFQVYALLLFLCPSLAPAPLILFLLVSAIASLLPWSSYYLPVISRGRKGGGGVALTFDDGPDPLVTPRVLDLLDRHGAKAAFFVTGANAERHPDLVRAILARGHAIGNHSQHHFPFLMLKGSRTLRREIEAAQTVLKGFGIVPLAFRPPVGVTNSRLRRLLLELGMFCVNFSCRAGDMGNRRIGQLARRILAKVRPRDIILLHDVTPPGGSVDQLLEQFEAILAGLEARGLEPRPLAQLIGKEVMGSGTSLEGLNPTELFYHGLAGSYDQEQFESGVSISRKTEQGLFDRRLPQLFQGAARVLEIGAGTGIFTIAIARSCGEVEAMDISGPMLAILEQKCGKEGIANVRTRLGDVESLALEGPYDVVCAFSALEYLKDLPGFLRRLAPHVRPGGTIYFITARTSLFRLFTQIGNAIRQGIWLKSRSRRQFRKMLAGAGFTEVSIDAHLLKCGISGGMLLEVVARKPLPS